MQTILLTGGTGYIGSHVAIELLRINYQVVIVDNLSNSYVEVIEKLKKIDNKLKFYQCDVNNHDHLNQVFQENSIDIVIHLAGHKSVEESVNDPLTYYQNNVGGLMTLLKCMELNKVNKIIFSSSATVYGNPKTLPLTEESEINTLNPYGTSKLICENILRDMSNLSVIILRYFNPVGAGLLKENPKKSYKNLFPLIMSIYEKEKEYLNVFGSDYPTKDGTAIRDYIHVVDLAKGHVKSIDYILQNNIKCEIFNLGTGQGYSVLEVIKGFEHHSGKKLPFVLKEKRKGEPVAIYANCQKANQILGWTAKYNLDDMINSTLTYKTTFVTALYAVEGFNVPNKTIEKYFEHFIKLAETGIPIIVYINFEFEDKIKMISKKYPNVKLLGFIDIKNSWIYQQINIGTIKLPTNRNPIKDCFEYMICINSKIECLSKAIQANPFNSEQFAWIDFGIFHVIKDIEKTNTMLKKLTYSRIDNLIFPGCWQLNEKYDYIDRVNWNFCGGFFIGKKEQLLDMWQRYQVFFPKFIQQYNTMVWEVNIWSALVHETDWKPEWYYAGHDDSILSVPEIYFR